MNIGIDLGTANVLVHIEGKFLELGARIERLAEGNDVSSS